MFETDLDHMEPVGVLGDKLRLKQVLINLLGNAVKFADLSGSIRLMDEMQHNNDDDITLRFSVIDRGIGMPPAQVSRLFAAFQQRSSSIATYYGGTGGCGARGQGRHERPSG